MSLYGDYLYPSTPPLEANIEFAPVADIAAQAVAHSRASSHSSAHSEFSSPESVRTTSTTPIRSPVRSHGPLLLPKIRPQDQSVEETTPQATQRVRSAPMLVIPEVNPYGFAPQPMMQNARVVTSPATYMPAQPVQTVFSPTGSEVESPVSLTSSRRSSTSYIDETVLAKYCYPTRHFAFPLPPTAYLQATTVNPAAAAPYLSQYTAPTPPSVHSQQHSRSQSLASDFSVEFPPTPAPYTPTTTLLNYLTAANPTPNLVRHINMSIGRSIRDHGNTHFWWDVRNIRSWKSFNLQSVHAVPHLTQLLGTHISMADLPEPKAGRDALEPDSEQALHLLYRDFYAEKVTSALKVALGEPNLAMRACFHTAANLAKPASRQAPEFVSNYVHDFTGRIFGEGKGRVVGLVKSFHRWNSGMRNEGPQKRVEYLAGLSHIHRHMREHGTRYGFIMTEIELVCVSLICGPHSNVPLFGGLMLSPPIPLNKQSPGELTACLALFYLHFLAKNHPPPGCPDFKVDVGGPSACSRQTCVPEKEKWIPEPQISEKREAKRVRGWVWPTEPLSRKELPRRGR